MMRMRTSLVVAAVLTVAALLSSTTLTSRSRNLRADDAPPAGGSPVLPVPDAPFDGVIGRKASESKPAFPKDITAPKGAPNVLLIMTDDTGFGATSTFGGPIPTPNFDRVARSGLKYNHFHTTA